MNRNKLMYNNCKTLFNFKIAILHIYNNLVMLTRSNKSLLKEDINFSGNISVNTGYNKNLIHKLYRKTLKEMDYISNA